MSSVADTSIRAFLGIMADGTSTTVRGKIFLALERSPMPMTRQELVKATGVSINTLSGQVTPMLDAKVIFESGTVSCSVTGNKAHSLCSRRVDLDARITVPHKVSELDTLVHKIIHMADPIDGMPHLVSIPTCDILRLKKLTKYGVDQ